MTLSAFILFILGVLQVSFFSFPDGLILMIKNKMIRFIDHICFWRYCKKDNKAENELDSAAAEDAPLEEVIDEKRFVRSITNPFVMPPTPNQMEAANDKDGEVIVDHDLIPRNDVPPVLCHKLRKVYQSLGGVPPKVALSSLDLHVPKGQVLGLLGKNGAGKTTALKILSMSHKASSGLALVAGYDVATEEIAVAERLGNCPQFDIFWPAQSVRRHLEFFSELKGLPKNKTKEIAHAFATAVGLGAPLVYDRPAQALSGGMRRRLSIAVSLIGAPNVLLLDEPSTGLDPSTRNSIWGLIDSFATSERAIVITTHNMIEADTLSNRIAIISHGQLKVVATQQRLKDRFGSGYLLQLNLIKSSSDSLERAMSFVREQLHPDAVLQTKQAKTLHIALPRDANLTQVFQVLYSRESSSQGGINQFLLSQSSLEDVFLALGD
jgi:ABC-type multidrug transport system ATPase subunit